MEIVNILNQYNVYIKENIIDDVIRQLDDNCLIIKDSNINLNVTSFDINVSEANKNLDTVNKLYDYYLENNVNRKSTTIIAIGGGCLLDIVGYSCATFMRGIRVVYIPTTLLAMVDACVGGKTAINYKGYKNYIGSFYQPECVVIDQNFLDTLPIREFNSGMAEVIKYGCIYDKTLLDYLLNDEVDINYIIKRSLEIKNHFISKDVYDKGLRQALNFGHTYGHAIESYYDFKKYTHGEAISIGMNLKCSDPLLKEVCKKYDLPIDLEEDIDLDKYLLKDKKNDGQINFIKLKSLGEVDETRLK